MKNLSLVLYKWSLETYPNYFKARLTISLISCYLRQNENFKSRWREKGRNLVLLDNCDSANWCVFKKILGLSVKLPYFSFFFETQRRSNKNMRQRPQKWQNGKNCLFEELFILHEYWIPRVDGVQLRPGSSCSCHIYSLINKRIVILFFLDRTSGR